jgi:lipopolysaccharide biosynthesis protein
MRLTAADDPPVVVTLPLPQHARFLVRNRRSRLAFAFHAADVASLRVRRLSPGNVAGLLRWRRKDLRLRGDLAPGVRLMPLFWAAGGESRTLAAGLRLLDRWGFGLGTRSFQETPALFEPPPDTVPLRVRDEPRFGVVLHLYYPDLWPEIRARLAALTVPFDLLVTLPPERSAFGAEIAAEFPGAEVRVLENRGRDVGPFIELLNEGRLDSWPLVLKIHGKRSGTSGARALLGEAWRKANCHDLFGSDAQVEAILARFSADPRIGMVGSARLRMPGGPVVMKRPFGLNRETTLALADRMGIPPDAFTLDFYSGTMFWVRPAMLAPLRELGLRLADFPQGAGPDDGALQHAVERLFGALAVKQGLRLEDAPLRYARREWR